MKLAIPGQLGGRTPLIFGREQEVPDNSDEKESEECGNGLTAYATTREFLVSQPTARASSEVMMMEAMIRSVSARILMMRW